MNNGLIRGTSSVIGAIKHSFHSGTLLYMYGTHGGMLSIQMGFDDVVELPP